VTQINADQVYFYNGGNTSTDLVTIEPTQPTSLVGAGFDTSSPLFQIRPGTLVINQPNTQVEDAIKGHFRVTQTGDQYKEMTVALLMTPEEARSYYIGEPGQMNRTSENLMCFSRDRGCHLKFRGKPQPLHLAAGPDKKSKAPEAPRCFGCPRSDWTPYRTFADKHPNQPVPKSLIPSCDPYYYMAFIDTEFQMPMEMYIRGDSIAPFEAHCQNLYRANLKYIAAKKRQPNVFDFKFTLQTKLVEKGKNKFYILNIPGTSIQVVSDEEREQFGGMFVQYAESRQLDGPESNTSRIVAAEADIDKAVAGTSVAPASDGITGDDDTIQF
jgi:hypothetical protein